MDNKEFGLWLKEARTKIGMTQDEFAKKIGLRFSQEIAAIESGTNPFPTKAITKLAELLGINREKIFKMHIKTKESDLRKKMIAG